MPDLIDNFTGVDGTFLDARDMSGTAGKRWFVLSGQPGIYSNKAISANTGSPPSGSGEFRNHDPWTAARTTISSLLYLGQYSGDNSIEIGCDATGANGYSLLIQVASDSANPSQINMYLQPKFANGSIDYNNQQQVIKPLWHHSDTLSLSLVWDRSVAGQTTVNAVITNTTQGNDTAILAFTDTRGVQPAGNYLAFFNGGFGAGRDNLSIVDSSAALSAGLISDPANAADAYSAQATQAGNVVLVKSSVASGGQAPYTFEWRQGTVDAGASISSPYGSLAVIAGQAAQNLSWAGYTPNRTYVIIQRVTDAAGAVAYSNPVYVKTRMASNVPHVIDLSNSLGGYKFAVEDLPPNRIEHRVPREPLDTSMPGYLYRVLQPQSVQMERHTYPQRTSINIYGYQSEWQQSLRDVGTVKILVAEAIRNDVSHLDQTFPGGYTTEQAAASLLSATQSWVAFVRAVAGQNIKVVIEGLHDLTNTGLPVTGITLAYNNLLRAAVGTWVDAVAICLDQPGDNTSAAFDAGDKTHPNAVGNQIRLLVVQSAVAAVSGGLIVVPDATPPSISSATVQISGTRIIVNTSEPTTGGGGLTFTRGGAALAATETRNSPTQLQYDLTGGATVYVSELVRMVYDPAVGALLDIAGNELAAFSNVTVVNDSTVPVPGAGGGSGLNPAQAATLAALATMIESDGAGGSRLTAAALAHSQPAAPLADDILDLTISDLKVNQTLFYQAYKQILTISMTVAGRGALATLLAQQFYVGFTPPTDKVAPALADCALVQATGDGTQVQVSLFVGTAAGTELLPVVALIGGGNAGARQYKPWIIVKGTETTPSPCPLIGVI